MKTEDIRNELSKMKVLFATNGWSGDGEIVNRSMSLYAPIAEHTYLCDSQGKSLYGYEAFLDIFKKALEDGFDYVIYVDADCFITSYANLLSEFMNFVSSGAVFSGVTDGGLICHRSHNRLGINPFIMFVRLSGIRDSYKNGTFDFGHIESYSVDRVSPSDVASWKATCGEYADYRKRHPEFKVPHADAISADWNPDKNKRRYYSMRQHPWTFRDTTNGEPYYKIFLSYLERHGTGMRFMYASDFPCKADPTGITTAAYAALRNADGEILAPGNMICLHTWFSRLYKCDNGDPFRVYHNGRINAVCDYAEKLLKENESRQTVEADASEASSPY